MLFLSSEDFTHNIPILRFYCGATCLYFPLLTISVLCTDLIYQMGKLSFLPFLGLMAAFEFGKYLFISVNFKEYDKYSVRHNFKSSGTACKKFFSEKRCKDIVKGFLVVCLMTVVFYIITVLFGADVFSKCEETFMFSLLLSILTVLPACLFLGPNHALSPFLGENGCSATPLSSVLQHVVRVTLLGAWLGAFVIPLDWDRSWQNWPVPCCVGALMGYVASHTSAMVDIALPRYVRNKISHKLR